MAVEDDINTKINQAGNQYQRNFLDTPPPAIEPFSYTYLGIKQLMAGGGVALIGMILVPQLTGLFG